MSEKVEVKVKYENVTRYWVECPRCKYEFLVSHFGDQDLQCCGQMLTYNRDFEKAEET